MKYNLIVALDFNDKRKALDLVSKLDPNLCALKVGSEMYTLYGPDFISLLIARGFKVFLDLKFHDIPTTVAKACLAAAELGVWMLNVHATGGQDMLLAASSTLSELPIAKRPILIAVTVLTSMQESDLANIGVNHTLDEHVLSLAKLAKQSGLSGVVASALEVPLIKKTCGADFITVTPGIRATTNQVNDQKRIVTVKAAQSLGSDYLVVGRPITQANDPLAAIDGMFNYA